MNLRETVSAQMVRVHEIPRELADHHVSQFDAAELRQRFKHYIRLGAELSAAGPSPKSCPDFYQVFGSATTTAGQRHSVALPGEVAVRTSSPMPESEEKTWSEGRGGLMPRQAFALPESETKNLELLEAERTLSGEGF